MRILISNDDGYLAPGIKALHSALSKVADVTVVAPEQNRSTASNSLTLDRPLQIRQTDDKVYCVNGTPSDCVHLAVTGFLPALPDLIVSGINMGANMGDDTIYSGTVAAAMEGYLLGIPSFAVSLVNHKQSVEEKDFAPAALWMRRLLTHYSAHPWSGSLLLNINVPLLPATDIKGFTITRLGKRHKAQPAVKMVSPREETMYWVGAVGAAADAGEGTDFAAVAAGKVSVTPLQVDLTHNAQMADLRDWMR